MSKYCLCSWNILFQIHGIQLDTYQQKLSKYLQNCDLQSQFKTETLSHRNEHLHVWVKLCFDLQIILFLPSFASFTPWNCYKEPFYFIRTILHVNIYELRYIYLFIYVSQMVWIKFFKAIFFYNFLHIIHS